MAPNDFIKPLMAKEETVDTLKAEFLPRCNRERPACLSSVMLPTVRANEVKRRLNYSDKLLPCG